jgi:magnesium-transporting ATPase (P-type)
MCSKHDKECEFGEEQELNEVRQLAVDGLRCISFGYCVVDTDEFMAIFQDGDERQKEHMFEDWLTTNFKEEKRASYLLTLALKDSLRDNIKEDVEYALNTAQLSVRMVSNDMEETAVACAKSAGILTNLANIDNENSTKQQVMSGDQFVERVGQG